MGRGGRWAGWDVGWGMVINMYSARLCLCGEGRRGGGEREGSSSFNKFPSTQSKTSPTLSTTSSITTSKSMSTDLKPSQSVTTSQQSPAKTKTLLVDVGVDGSGGRVGAGVEMGVASHLFSWTNSSGERRRGGMGSLFSAAVQWHPSESRGPSHPPRDHKLHSGSQAGYRPPQTY